jgi:hypothetical protein
MTYPTEDDIKAMKQAEQDTGPDWRPLALILLALAVAYAPEIAKVLLGVLLVALVAVPLLFVVGYYGE